MAARRVSFELYALTQGRWQYHASFSGAQRDQAVEAARQLDAEGFVDAVCVVRESFDSTSNTSSESVVYQGGRKKAPPPTSAAPAPKEGAPARLPVPDVGASGESVRPRRDPPPEIDIDRIEIDTPPPADSGVVASAFKLAFAAIIAFGVGVLAALAASYGTVFLVRLGFDGLRDWLGTLQAATFVVVSLLVFLPMFTRIMRAFRAQERTTAERNEEASPAPRHGRPRPPAASPIAPARDPDVRPPEPDAIEEEAAPADPPPGPETAGQLSGGQEAVGRELARLSEEAQRRFGLDIEAYPRFGLILFMGGMSEVLCHAAGLKPQQATAALTLQIERLGANRRMAAGFAANIDEYLLKPRNFAMYDAGRSAATARLASPMADIGLEGAMRAWQAPSSEPPPALAAGVADGAGQTDGFVAVLFTDIVDSTKGQQDNGDDWAYSVKRAHDDIVREALNRFGGRRIKHLGDGIMATFPSAIRAVDGACAMQKGFAHFSRAVPKMAFGVRIGIAAGEPIHEKGDVFGTPVNLAARMMGKAGAGEIAVSQTVHDLCQGKGKRFEAMGHVTLKGFETPQPVYKVHPNELAPA